MHNQRNPLVSVLMTVYNRQKYIADAIESIVASTYENWELIIVDDQSTDNSVKIARKYEESDPRIRVYINEENLGDYPNRNKAASYAQGEYLKYLDADDLLYPHGLQVMVYYMERNPTAALALTCNSSLTEPFPVLMKPREAYYEKFFGKGLMTNSPIGAIIRKDVFDELGGFRTERYTGDSDMWLRISSKYPILKIMKGLGFWRSHGEQETGIKGNLHPNDYKLLLRNLTDESCPLKPEETKDILKAAKRRQMRHIIKLMIYGQYGEAQAILKELNFKPMELYKAF